MGGMVILICGDMSGRVELCDDLEFEFRDEVHFSFGFDLIHICLDSQTRTNTVRVRNPSGKPT